MKFSQYIIVFSAFLLCSFAAQSQIHLGAKGGATHSTFKGENTRGVVDFVYGGAGALSLEYELSNVASFYSELGYYAKGAKFVDTDLGNSTGTLTVDERLHYLSLPLYLKITSGREEKFDAQKGYGRSRSKTQAYILVGISLSKLLKRNLTASAMDEYGTYLDVDRYYNHTLQKLDQSFDIGAGLVYRGFWLDARMSNSLISIFDPEFNDPLLVRNYAVSLQLGYTRRITLGKKPF